MTMLPPPGWYPDPNGGGGRRYWDGTQWPAKREFKWWASLIGAGYPIAAYPMATPPAVGWYPEAPSSTDQRYWDGTRWIERGGKKPSSGFTLGVGLPLHDVALRWAMYGFFVSFLVMGGFVGAVAVIAGLIARYRASRGIQNRYDSPQLTIATATIAIAVGLLDMVIGAIAFNLWET
ncbi:MAG: hypothetical protein QOG19_2980 [Mycobacterium sp.]|nr:hypothetical protein [Mycobacterium sp.]